MNNVATIIEPRTDFRVQRLLQQHAIIRNDRHAVAAAGAFSTDNIRATTEPGRKITDED